MRSKKHYVAALGNASFLNVKWKENFDVAFFNVLFFLTFVFFSMKSLSVEFTLVIICIHCTDIRCFKYAFGGYFMRNYFEQKVVPLYTSTIYLRFW